MEERQAPLKIDHTDRKLMELLDEDGRMPNKELAKRLALSEGTIRNRLRKLIHAKYLRVRGLTNPCVRSDMQVVYIMAKVPLHSGWDETARRVAELREVKSVSLIAGRFDLLIEVFLEPNNLAAFMNEQLSRIKTIESTESLVAMNHYDKWV